MQGIQSLARLPRTSISYVCVHVFNSRVRSHCHLPSLGCSGNFPGPTVPACPALPQSLRFSSTRKKQQSYTRQGNTVHGGGVEPSVFVLTLGASILRCCRPTSIARHYQFPPFYRLTSVPSLLQSLPNSHCVMLNP